MFFTKFSTVNRDMEVRVAERYTVWLYTVPARPDDQTWVHCYIFCCIWHKRGDPTLVLRPRTDVETGINNFTFTVPCIVTLY